QPTTAFSARNSRPPAPPSARMYPASAYSGMAGSTGETLSPYISFGTTATDNPWLQNHSIAAPPNTAKIGIPSAPATSNTISPGRKTGYPANQGSADTPAGNARPMAAIHSPRQPVAAFRIMRTATRAKLMGMIVIAAHTGIPRATTSPDSRSTRNNSRLAG